MMCNLAPNARSVDPISPTWQGLPGFLAGKSYAPFIGHCLEITKYPLAKGKKKKNYEPARDPKKTFDTIIVCVTKDLSQTLRDWIKAGFSSNVIIREDGQVFLWINPLEKKHQCAGNFNDQSFSLLVVGEPNYDDNGKLMGYTLSNNIIQAFEQVAAFCIEQLPTKSPLKVVDYSSLKGSRGEGIILNINALQEKVDSISKEKSAS